MGDWAGLDKISSTALHASLTSCSGVFLRFPIELKKAAILIWKRNFCVGSHFPMLCPKD
jgi:hypothetical protein